MSAPPSTIQPVYEAPKLTKLTPQQRSDLQTKQLATFLGLGAITVATALVGKRSVLKRKCMFMIISLVIYTCSLVDHSFLTYRLYI